MGSGHRSERKTERLVESSPEEVSVSVSDVWLPSTRAAHPPQRRSCRSPAGSRHSSSMGSLRNSRHRSTSDRSGACSRRAIGRWRMKARSHRLREPSASPESRTSTVAVVEGEERVRLGHGESRAQARPGRAIPAAHVTVNGEESSAAPLRGHIEAGPLRRRGSQERGSGSFAVRREPRARQTSSTHSTWRFHPRARLPQCSNCPAAVEGWAAPVVIDCQ